MAVQPGSQRHHLGREAIHTCWDRGLPPRLTIAPGDTVVFQTLEPSWGGVARDVASGVNAGIDPGVMALVASHVYPESPKGPGTELEGHALTGPVAIAGAEPGDTLAVEVLEVVPGEWGWTACGPGGGSLVGDELSDWELHLWDLRERNRAVFAPGITIPLAPFCGVMGVAPADAGPHPTIPPRPVGGNLDVRQLTAGTTLYLPIQVPQALFSVGDAHAAQGDGEVGGTGIETDATVTLRFTLLKDQSIAGPRFLTRSQGLTAGPWFAATSSHADLYAAARDAVKGVLTYFEERRGLSRPQACILASVCVDLRMSQIVNGGVYTVSAFLPLSIFDT
jgi:acetamidase/formamidase